MITRIDLIEGLANMCGSALKKISEQKFQNYCNALSKFSNELLCQEYFKATGNLIRPILSNQFIYV